MSNFNFLTSCLDLSYQYPVYYVWILLTELAETQKENPTEMEKFDASS